MSDFRKYVFGYDLLPISWLIKISAQNIFLPFYHTISDKHLPHISNIYPIRSVEQFRRDLEYLCRHFVPITIEELTGIVRSGTKPPKPVFHITFDDGLSGCYSHVAPILAEMKIPATFFINTDFIDNKGLFYRYKVSLIIERLKQHNANEVDAVADVLGVAADDVENQLLKLKHADIELIDAAAIAANVDFADYLARAKPYMTNQNIFELQKQGFAIGSHSASHPHFSSISPIEQERQIVDSFGVLESSFGIKQRYFAFPFHDDGVSANFILWLHNEQNCRLSFGTAGLKHDIENHLHRVPFEGTNYSAKKIIKTEYCYFIAKWLVGKNRIFRAKL